jgi:hypothetical protein
MGLVQLKLQWISNLTAIANQISNLTAMANQLTNGFTNVSPFAIKPSA